MPRPRTNLLGYNPVGNLTSSWTDLGGRSRGNTGSPAFFGVGQQFRPSMTRIFPPPPPGTIKKASATSRVATGPYARWDFRGMWGGITRGLGVSGKAPSTGAIAGPPTRAVAPAGNTPGQNVVNPLFGRPGFTYSLPQRRMGPVAKLSPGTGNTGRFMENRALGLVLPGYSTNALGVTQEELGMNLMDYLPPTNPNYGGKAERNSSVIPRSIHVGSSGKELMPTYNAHDFTPADRFFKQGRSAAMWTDGAFPPEYRYLLTRQQVARFNLYTELALARPIGPNAYTMGYSTQAAQASQMGGSGLRPLGFG